MLRDEENASLKKGLEFLLGWYFSPGDCSSRAPARSMSNKGSAVCLRVGDGLPIPAYRGAWLLQHVPEISCEPMKHPRSVCIGIGLRRALRSISVQHLQRLGDSPVVLWLELRTSRAAPLQPQYPSHGRSSRRSCRRFLGQVSGIEHRVNCSPWYKRFSIFSSLRSLSPRGDASERQFTR